jgi:hypothetical protein
MFYAARWVTLAGRRKMLYMHHAIIGKPQPGYVTDHKDRNGLNNQNHNLHQVTHAINAMNNGTTGVSWCLARNKWLAQIQIGGVKFNLGRFDDEGAAITARETFKQTYLYDPPPY